LMKIQPNPNIIQAMQTYNKNRPGAVKKSGEVTSPQDKMELSPKALEFQAAMKAYQKLPEVRHERVEEVKTKMAEGKMATPEEVAEKMMAGINRKDRF